MCGRSEAKFHIQNVCGLVVDFKCPISVLDTHLFIVIQAAKLSWSFPLRQFNYLYKPSLLL